MSDEDNPREDDDQFEPSGQVQGEEIDQPAAQPAGQAPPVQGQQPVQQGPSLLDELQRPESVDWLKFNVALFAVFGFGYSIAFFLMDTLASDTSAAGALLSDFLGFLFLMGLFLAPILAVITGVRIGREFHAQQNLTLANSFVGSAVGFIVMFFVLFVFVWSQAETSGGGGLGEFLGPIIGFAIGVGLTGVLSTFVVRWAESY